MRALRIAVAWLLVGVPLGWGVTQSVKKAMPLFGVGGVSKAAPAGVPVPKISVQTNSTALPRP